MGGSAYHRDAGAQEIREGLPVESCVLLKVLVNDVEAFVDGAIFIGDAILHLPARRWDSCPTRRSASVARARDWYCRRPGAGPRAASSVLQERQQVERGQPLLPVDDREVLAWMPLGVTTRLPRK